ncbi:MAG TPA: DUF1585 domain-containing protein [Kofleriaceae bacterium]|jgi:hypothetical protein
MRIWPTLVLALAACGSDRAAPAIDAPPASPTLQYLTPAQHLTRASLALRGLRPSVDELQAVTVDPTMLPSFVDQYLASPEFLDVMMELHNEQLLMRMEQPQFVFPSVDALAGKSFAEVNSILDEPLRLIADVIGNDQPYTDIVTADYTMMNGATATLWGLPHVTDPANWEHTQYTDGRGAGGILTTNALYHRWRSTGFNYNRGRANLISRALLCHDFLASDIAVDTSVDLSNPDIVANAVVQNPSCAGCHQTLDALASYAFEPRGSINTGATTTYPVTIWNPNSYANWRTTNKREPMFFGEPTAGANSPALLGGLGASIANDPRFAQCAATHFATYFTEVPVEQLDSRWIAQLGADFAAGGFDAKALAKAIVLSDQFRVAYETDPAKADTLVGALKVRPEQYDRMLADLTGFAWTTTSTLEVRGANVGTEPLLTSDFIGFRVLAGGLDSYFVTAPVLTMNATSSLVAKAAANASASFVVDHDGTAGVQPTLFTVAPVTATDEASVRAQLAYLHARIYGELVDPNSPEVGDTYALFTAALAQSSDPARAWKVTLAAMLSDFRSIFY